MPSKYYNRNFKSQHFYHIFNRGAYKHKIFLDKSDYTIFTSILAYYLNYPKSKNFAYQKKVNKFQVRNLEKTVHLVTYCLMPNHFHLLLKQLPIATNKTNISNLMRRLIITYAMYFQNKYQHTGALLQGRYKNVLVDTNQQLLHLSKYIHQNPLSIHKDLAIYPYSSYQAYINTIQTPKWLHSEYVLKHTKNYQQFIKAPVKKTVSKKISSLTLD